MKRMQRVVRLVRVAQTVLGAAIAGVMVAPVLVRAQTVIDGKVSLQAVEGHVAKDSVQPNAVVPLLVTALANKIASVLERYLLLINVLPGACARATLTASGPEEEIENSSVRVILRGWFNPNTWVVRCTQIA
jgi:hypothetical protein